MPLGILLGALFCRQIELLDKWCNHMITPVMIVTMLFFNFCRVNLRSMRPSFMYVWLFAFQILGAIVLYYSLVVFDETVAQGAMICVLAPIAMAAVVIGSMLGASVEKMATYTLLCNIGTAVFAPMVLTLAGNGDCSFMQIASRIVPLLIVPFVVAQICRFTTPRVAQWFASHSQLSFYIWLASLVVIIGRTTSFIIDFGSTQRLTTLTLALIAGVVCVSQFAVGRIIGGRFGDESAGRQALGQKNTILAVWMAQSFLNPLACIAPTAYIVWQNVINSYQIYKYNQK